MLALITVMFHCVKILSLFSQNNFMRLNYEDLSALLDTSGHLYIYCKNDDLIKVKNGIVLKLTSSINLCFDVLTER